MSNEIGYSISVFNFCGEMGKVYVPDFQAVVVEAVRLKGMYPNAGIVVVNQDNCDYDSSGLTKDERDALFEALAEVVS